MRKLIAVVTLIAAPLVAATPTGAMAGRQAAVSGDAGVATAGPARGGLAHPFMAPPAPQVRDAATPRQSDQTRSGDRTAMLPRHRHDVTATMATRVAAAATPATQVSAGSALARAPPADAVSPRR